MFLFVLMLVVVSCCVRRKSCILCAHVCGHDLECVVENRSCCVLMFVAVIGSLS